jgi:hypothetical protein
MPKAHASTKEPLVPEVRFSSPDSNHPGIFKLRDVGILSDRQLEVLIEWHDGTYGSKVPVVVVRPVLTP